MTLAWLPGSLTTCKEKTVAWEPSASVPDRFYPSATRLTAGAALLGGYLQGGEVGAVEDQRAKILRWEGGAPVSTYSGAGWITTLSVEGACAWAVAAQFRPDGTDGGRAWSAWRVPAQATAEAADLGAGGAAVYVDVRRRLVAAPGTFAGR